MRGYERLADLLDRLLDVTRPEEETLQLKIAEADLAALAQKVVNELCDVFAEAHCELTVRSPAALVAKCDPVRILRGLRNLLINAVKFGRGKAVLLELAGQGAAVVIRVTDNGIGVARHEQQRIFLKFGRAVPEQHYGGFGVGLWMCKRILEAHGGRIDVENRPQGGALFSRPCCRRLPEISRPAR